MRLERCVWLRSTLQLYQDHIRRERCAAQAHSAKRVRNGRDDGRRTRTHRRLSDPCDSHWSLRMGESPPTLGPASHPGFLMAGPYTTSWRRRPPRRSPTPTFDFWRSPCPGSNRLKSGHPGSWGGAWFHPVILATRSWGMLSCPASLSTMIASLGLAQMTSLNVPRNDQARSAGGGHSQGPPALAMWLSRAYHPDC